MHLTWSHKSHPRSQSEFSKRKRPQTNPSNEVVLLFSLHSLMNAEVRLWSTVCSPAPRVFPLGIHKELIASILNGRDVACVSALVSHFLFLYVWRGGAVSYTPKPSDLAVLRVPEETTLKQSVILEARTAPPELGLT